MKVGDRVLLRAIYLGRAEGTCANGARDGIYRIKGNYEDRVVIAPVSAAKPRKKAQ